MTATPTTTTGADLLTVEQAARRLGTGPRFIRRLVAERRIRFYKVGKYVRFHPDDITNYIRQGQVDPIRPVLTYQKGAPAYA
ncbi:helix-turn-helix domain-containing protein [Polymorphospora rubra]|uniref:helix-turn-helix domain-containing protein n=1 Tax=Polymorphospora rubra TaxID=338584 RepID=UPI0033D8E5F0